MNPHGKKLVPLFVFTLHHERVGLAMSHLYVLEAELSGDYAGVKRMPEFITCCRHGAPKDIPHFHGAPGTRTCTVMQN